jgi:hypothetical protein
VSGTYAVELADTHRDPEALSYQMLDFAARGKHAGPAVIQHKGEHLSSKLRGVTVAPLDAGVLAFVLDTTRVADTQ